MCDTFLKVSSFGKGADVQRFREELHKASTQWYSSGKTVTLKTIAGLFRPDSGSILIRGRETIGISDQDRSEIARIGVLFQRSALFDSMTVWEPRSKKTMR